MGNESKKTRVLVIGSEAVYQEVIGKSLDEFEVLSATNEDEGLALARNERPDAIVLGYLESRGTSYGLHKKLRAGWITKNTPLLIVEMGGDDNADKRWTRHEALEMDADDYITISADDSASIALLKETIGLTEKITVRMGERASTLKGKLLDQNDFCITWEQIPGRGAFEIAHDEVLDNVAKAAAGGKVDAISVTDNPGGNPALSTEMLCVQIQKSGMEPLVHLACRDKNRSEIESLLCGMAAEGIKNVLVLTGDYSGSDAFEGLAKPVFDLDPPNVLRLVEKMNDGLEHKAGRKTIKLAATDLYAGACVSPFKKLESELMSQYAKLKKKIEAGAKFIIPQLGYDARKFHEILTWLKVNNYNVPVMMNIYVLPFGTGRFMNGNGIPGCVVTDKQVAELAEEKKAADKGKSAMLLKAAKMYAIGKGMGMGGAHIAGHGITYEQVEFIIDKGEELAGNWKNLVAEFDYPQDDGFYLFEKDKESGLNTEVYAERTSQPKAPLMYKFTRLAHHLIFEEKSPVFKVLKPVLGWIDNSTIPKHVMDYCEHMAKVSMFNCMNCGDCALFDTAYVCPMSQCPKSQRNGPCGGSYEGWCEVYPNEKKCIWVQAYDRLKPYKEEDNIAAYTVPPCNWQLWQTSSWLNFYMGRDHSAKRLGIKPPEPKETPQK
ncbi:MAG: methylenetetrahydrofolate reductase C-terminal domain-containing protein [Pseudomonadota bacterium]|nr:methylenetetrahydrofolate reductase C-terminal domain-containing protein [Pseudomonadota bacterium]